MTQTTDQTVSTPLEPALYMAMEVSSSQWKLAFARGFEKPRIRNVSAGNFERLREEIRRAKSKLGLAEEASVYSCYEAGRDAFWIHRELLRRRWHNVVVDPASIEVERRRRQRKTDRLDALKLVRVLVRWRQGEQDVWRVVCVPTAEQEDLRRLHRERKRLVKERTAHLARIRSLLATQGPVPPQLDEQVLHRHWKTGAKLPKRLAAEMRREWERLELLKRQLRDVERTMAEEENEATPEMQKVRDLKRFRGIGSTFARVLITEFFGWRRFRNRREVGALTGMTGTPYDSGNTDREQGISKAGNRWVRSMAIEMAWMWLRHQPDTAIARWYRERFGEGQRIRKIGIVAVARRLMIALWRYLEFGEVPEGAVVSA